MTAGERLHDLLAAGSAPVTQLGERLMWVVVMVGVIAGLFGLMWMGWKHRGVQQEEVLPELPPVPRPEYETLAAADGFYVSTTTSGDWLDRIVAHGLGHRARATLSVTRDGVLFARDGDRDLYIPAAQLRAISRARGMAGKFVERGGLLVITWEHGDHALATGFRAETTAAHGAVERAVTGLLAESEAA